MAVLRQDQLGRPIAIEGKGDMRRPSSWVGGLEFHAPAAGVRDRGPWLGFSSILVNFFTEYKNMS